MRRGIRIAAVVMCLLIAVGVSAEGKKEEGVIKIGAFLDLSGPTAQWGKDAERGAQIRVREVNEAGGIMGKKVERGGRL